MGSCELFPKGAPQAAHNIVCIAPVAAAVCWGSGVDEETLRALHKLSRGKRLGRLDEVAKRLRPSRLGPSTIGLNRVFSGLRGGARTD